jgi:hypothetical protein
LLNDEKKGEPSRRKRTLFSLSLRESGVRSGAAVAGWDGENAATERRVRNQRPGEFMDRRNPA